MGSDKKQEGVLHHQADVHGSTTTSQDEVVGFVAELDELPKGTKTTHIPFDMTDFHTRLFPLQVLPRLDLCRRHGLMGSDRPVWLRSTTTRSH